MASLRGTCLRNPNPTPTSGHNSVMRQKPNPNPTPPKYVRILKKQKAAETFENAPQPIGSFEGLRARNIIKKAPGRGKGPCQPDMVSIALWGATPHDTCDRHDRTPHSQSGERKKRQGWDSNPGNPIHFREQNIREQNPRTASKVVNRT